MKKLLLSLLLFLMLVPFAFSTLSAQETDVLKDETLEGKIVEVIETKNISFEDGSSGQKYQKLKVYINKGSIKSQEIVIESGAFPSANIVEYKVGDKVLITKSVGIDGESEFYITDYVRRTPMLILSLIFVLLTVLIGRIRGALSLLGMGISFAVIFVMILPRILSSGDPVETAILGSFIIIPATFFLSHGFNKKTGVAIAGTLLSLIIVGVLSVIFVDLVKLTGFASEEAGFLQTMIGESINIKGLLLAGIIIGVLGVLDDITISQSAIVYQLKKANSSLKAGELYKRAMDIGQDHISSMVNTLVLVYAGAALPLLIIFVSGSHSFSEIINYEIVADEVVRTMVGSIGLIMAVPITTFIATMVVSSSKISKEK